jgi:hypothetical protein
LMEVLSVIEIGSGIMSALIFMAKSPCIHPSSCAAAPYFAWMKVYKSSKDTFAGKTVCPRIKPPRSSLPRRRESRSPWKDWIPAFAGMTKQGAFGLLRRRWNLYKE